jgi:hypothetical protein
VKIIYIGKYLYLCGERVWLNLEDVIVCFGALVGFFLFCVYFSVFLVVIAFLFGGDWCDEGFGG